MLNRLKNRAKNAAEENIGNKVEKGVNDLLDGKVGKNKDKNNDSQESSKSENTSTAAGTWTCPECGAANTGKFCEECGAKKPDGAAPAVGEANPQAATSTDFKRGEVILFEDDFTAEVVGEFPSKWDLLDGNAEVKTLGGIKAVEITGEGVITPLIKEQGAYLPEEFTIEFDVLSQPAEEGSGWDATLDLRFYGEDNNGKNEDDRVFQMRTSIETSGEGKYKGDYGSIDWDWDSWSPTGNEISGTVEKGTIRKVFKKNDWNHIAISFNKRALKVYLNYSRIVNIPNQKQPRWWWMEGSSDSNKGVYVTNIVMAKGAVELYERNATDYSSAVEKAIAETGKFVTNNILFDTGKATIKPESQEEIQKVADYMLKNPGARFEVQGHTDNQGSDKVNDPLSQQRAEAVVKALEGLGVDPFNLRAVGKGAHEPIADNGTDEGRAKNRRVEFIKK